MKILAIETSCDETAIAVISKEGETYSLLANVVQSQVDLHKEYGGVFPTIAKREHTNNTVPVLIKALADAKLLVPHTRLVNEQKRTDLHELFSREPGLANALIELAETTEIPALDAIAVTHGPGLAPALWVGVNVARALSILWEKPIIPINHMEGHLVSPFIKGKDFSIPAFSFPVLGLLVSGGHTELILMPNWFVYEKIGQTLDDAAGEAFDKVARTIGLPYPGGPVLSKLGATIPREEGISFPRPMINSADLNFSFSGLKTAVLYHAKKVSLDDSERARIARGFEDAVVDVLIEKTKRAIQAYAIETVLLGGGVAANKTLRERLSRLVAEECAATILYLPELSATGDNAAMIALAAMLRHEHMGERAHLAQSNLLVADGNLSLA